MRRLLLPLPSMVRRQLQHQYQCQNQAIILNCVFQNKLVNALHNYGQKRHASWIKPGSLSPFGRMRNQPSHQQQAQDLIVEDAEIDPVKSQLDEYVSELKHHLSVKLTDEDKLIQLSNTLAAMVQDIPTFAKNQNALKTFNKVVLKLYELNNKSFENSLPGVDKVSLFEKSTLAFTQIKYSVNRNLQVPPYIVLLSRDILYNTSEAIPAHLALYMVVLGSELAHTEFEDAIDLFYKNKSIKIDPEATEWFLKYLEERGRLNTTIFEKIFYSSVNNNRHLMVTDEYCSLYLNYIEKLFEDVPVVHDYKNPNKNIDRLADLASNISRESPKLSLSTETKLKLSKLIWELDSVLATSKENLGNSLVYQSISNIFTPMLTQKEEAFQEIREAIFRQPLDEELLVDSLLSLLAAGLSSIPELNELNKIISEFVVLDDVKFSPEIRFKAFCCLLSGTEDEILTQITSKIAEIEAESAITSPDTPVDRSKLYVMAVETTILKQVASPVGQLMDGLNTYFQQEYMDTPLYVYKHKLDGAIRKQDFPQALTVFNESVDMMTWPTNSDPLVRKTLNELIILGSKQYDTLETFQPFYKLVKRQMVNCPIDAGAINVVAELILKEDKFVDIYDLLRRELPLMLKDSQDKITLEGPLGARYMPLFQTIHNYILAYDKGTDFDLENIWVIFGELHRYFKVPSEFYLPSMKYFCSRGRHNGALIILRQMLRLHELHVEEHRIAPPLKEIYMFLLNEFGDQLYEEGVMEVHEILKMDINIPKQDLKLQNCILNAYSNLQNVEEVRNLFLSMAAAPESVEGINQESIQIMIKSLTYSDISYVKQFWSNLSQYDIPVNYAIFKQYLIAHVYSGQQRQAIELVGEMENYDLTFTEDTLLALYNYSLHPEDQDLIQDWATESHPQLWLAVRESGLLTPAEARDNTHLLTD